MNPAWLMLWACSALLNASWSLPTEPARQREVQIVLHRHGQATAIPAGHPAFAQLLSTLEGALLEARMLRMVMTREHQDLLTRRQSILEVRYPGWPKQAHWTIHLPEFKGSRRTFPARTLHITQWVQRLWVPLPWDMRPLAPVEKGRLILFVDEGRGGSAPAYRTGSRGVTEARVEALLKGMGYVLPPLPAKGPVADEIQRTLGSR